MIVRVATMTVGAVSAGLTALIQVSESAPPSVALGWSVFAGIAGAGVTYGVTTAKVNSAHAKIAAEKADRIQAVGDLKDDVNRGFERIERQIESQLGEQTRVVLEAMRSRGP
jgi:hypothetical protein